MLALATASTPPDTLTPWTPCWIYIESICCVFMGTLHKRNLGRDLQVEAD